MPSFRLCEEAVAWRAFEGEGTLLHLDRQEIHVMNVAATAIIERLRKGPATQTELAGCLQEAFEVDDNTARRDVLKFLDALREAGILDVTGEETEGG